MIIIVARLPILSQTSPKRGVKIMVPVMTSEL